MLTAEENDRLCRIEGKAPMGTLMRRHWIPAVLSEQVSQPDGDPVRVKLLGEDLVAFRDTKGRLGVIGAQCLHRKVSLAFGRNEDCGLRCLYHGWKFDVEGNVLDMPSEPRAAAMAPKLKQKAYPVREAGGFVWVYMGDPKLMPEFEAPPWAPTPTAKVSIARWDLPCNWAQITEGQIDSAHSSTLHSSDMRPAQIGSAEAKDTHWLRPSTDKMPRIQVQVTNYGMRYAAIRKPIARADTHDYVRITTFVAPFISLIPPNSSYNVASVIVPKDDTSSYFHFIAWTEDDSAIDRDAWRKFCVAEIGVDVDQDFKPILRHAGNRYLQDRAAMRGDGNFTGFPGIPNQDIPMWESMGTISDRTSERLGASDIAIIQFRRIMLDALTRFEAGDEPIGLASPHLPQAKLCSYQGIVAKQENWRLLGASTEERQYLLGMEESAEDREMAAAAKGSAA
ncbi:MAG TPA: Rieske 2Fe-2S domain-containing protein [Stellaceae bacterium]|nr:Rieske 2Fe-2S domain-containing protein [Stellaceae bacterium]